MINATSRATRLVARSTAIATSRARIVGALLAFALALVAIGSSAGAGVAVAADNSCNCVMYVRQQTGLPGGPSTAAGYQESWMNSHGYRRVNPSQGAIMVWDANRKGAGGSGHIAIVSSARYDNPSRKWIISVRHANWGGCGIRSTSFTWGDLYGVNSYVRR